MLVAIGWISDIYKPTPFGAERSVSAIHYTLAFISNCSGAVVVRKQHLIS